ncbi:MAG: hypothetical protein SVX38_07755 [Chloroflexota bacterium]|nr:hypothetical protein [Chloroflexota bacterium]
MSLSWWIAVIALSTAVVLSPRARTRDRMDLAIQAMLLLTICFVGLVV